MRLSKEHIWPLIGLVAVVFSAWLLVHQLRNISLDDILLSLDAIPLHRWLLAALATAAAYKALAGYDSIALQHLDKHIPWPFVAATSFTTYALAHNIGASVASGALVRYRAYTSKGLSGAEVGVLVALCSFTFALGTILLAGLVLLIKPELLTLLYDDPAPWVPYALSAFFLGLVVLYMISSLLGLPSLKLGRFQVHYPAMSIVKRQLIIGPLELLSAAAIIYFALPEASNPGYLVVLGVFLASFSAALLSHAPGGLGVLEALFLLALPEVNPADVIAALLVFRLFYLLIPFAFSLLFILMFERHQLADIFRRKRSSHHE
mgnify:CR=1 FL=1